MILADVSISEIQFTLDAGDGTYPSPLAGQTVTTGGIVTATDFSNGRYFISSSEGGAWNGIYVYDDSHSPTIGDSLYFHAEVYEYHGFTELKSLSNFSTVSSGNLPPSAFQTSTSDIAGEEAYESVLVEVNNVGVTSGYDSYDEWRISDGSGECIVSNEIFNLADLDVSLITAYPFSTVRGVVAYSWGEFRLHPRNIEDIQAMPDAYIISTGSADAYDFSEVEIPIQLALFGSDVEVQSFDFEIMYNPAIVQYSGYSEEGTLSSGGVVSDNSTSGRVTISYSGQLSLTNIGNLLNISFIPIDAGNADLIFSSAHVNGHSLLYKTGGNIGVFVSGGETIGDTLTIIQRPLLNIPAIVTPGDTLEVTCLAPESATGWTADLQHDYSTVDLELLSSNYNTSTNRWLLKFPVPEPDLFELYNLHISGDGIEDYTENSVRIIPVFKENFSFIHITDTHLATHYFFENPESIGDTSEMVDLREVINDINLINPEFLLITGDLINEGELEDFENRRNFSKAVRLLSELEVPVYLVSGNHDLGGWDSTPPAQGSARWNWWKFFGWNWLSAPPAAELTYTQDYSFDYGVTHFTGMESYINYDGFRWSTYGGESFISSQLQWLNADLAAASESQLKVLFYHYDFSDDINLNALGVDMALWGHIHSSSGNINEHPYDLSTDNTCDGNCAYRIIQVEGSNLQPQETVYATRPQTQSLSITFDQNNDGGSDTVSALISNNHSLAFEDAQVKFFMPIGDHGYSVENGVLKQVIRSGDIDVCYVSTDLEPNSQTTVTLVVDPDLVSTAPSIPQNWSLSQNYPNPFNPSTTIQFELAIESLIQLSVYSVDGRLIRTLINDNKPAGQHNASWDGLNNLGTHVSSGVYFYSLESPDFSQTKKMTLIR